MGGGVLKINKICVTSFINDPLAHTVCIKDFDEP
jgi:hypothetical protein